MRLIEINGKVVYGYSFHSLALATSFVTHCHKPHRVMLGDCPCFWVVSPRDAERLTRAGYEHAE